MIRKWHLKAMVQKSISYLPYKQHINYWFQKHVTKGVQLTDEYFGYKITHARDHINFYKTFAKKNQEDTEVLELGTGWYPIIPIAFYLSGFKKTISIDLSDWLTTDNIKITARKFLEWKASGKMDNYLSETPSSRWKVIEDLASTDMENVDAILPSINMARWVGDARTTPFADSSFEFICSNNTFEHIYKEILIQILEEFKRIVAANGVMSHFIDMSDHFAHFDKRINIYNFLRYSKSKWNLIDNSIQPQNRMRLSDYRKIYDELNIPISEESITKGKKEDLEKIPVNAEYDAYEFEDLLTSHAYIISKMN